MTEIHRASVQISRPMGTDPGTVEQACYFIEKGTSSSYVIVTARPSCVRRYVCVVDVVTRRR